MAKLQESFKVTDIDKLNLVHYSHKGKRYYKEGDQRNAYLRVSLFSLRPSIRIAPEIFRPARQRLPTMRRKGSKDDIEHRFQPERGWLVQNRLLSQDRGAQACSLRRRRMLRGLMCLTACQPMESRTSEVATPRRFFYSGINHSLQSRRQNGMMLRIYV